MGRGIGDCRHGPRGHDTDQTSGRVWSQRGAWHTQGRTRVGEAGKTIECPSNGVGSCGRVLGLKGSWRDKTE